MECLIQKTAVTPLPNKINISSKENLTLFSDVNKYQKAVGCLIYLSNSTRPDITYSVNLLARKLINPSIQDWTLVKRIYRYLKKTKNYKIIYKKNSNNIIKGFSDSSYADCNDRKSTGGYVFIMNDGAISWKSKKQNIVALSSTEAEFIALADCSKEALWLLKLVSELDSKNKKSLIIYEDNQSSIKLCSNHIHNDRSKHIDVRLFFLRDLVNNGVLTINYISTKDQIADIFTKALLSELHHKFVQHLGFVT